MSTGITITKKETPSKEKTKKAIDDEEFEEFPVQEWAERTDDADDEEMNVWEDNWDDETHESDFSKQLKYVMFTSHSRIYIPYSYTLFLVFF
ncbi:DSS1/SEM1 family protein [Oesophagostomum dentatum]|uniref:26S proteasome complex subunit dss-1 n=1 Tax=Oesophagostomum dentatum TaxID=61180 RepID=A0A0B1SNH0_OESDE|nr:DSS1/SEM1 family protein [Oesophagostomum dentatum]